MKKKTWMIAIVCVLILFAVFLISTGGKITGIMINDYSVSQDGTVMTMRVGVVSSMGYTRSLATREDENKKYVTFYSTYGLNSSLGAKSTFDIALRPDCNEIYFASSDGKYRLMLQKNSETNEWERAALN